ncbi:MAG TPA: hypothetical protein VK078_06975 [Pseudogracilibacillus sp.]|nr:hypothetical protein [Pseudogracilibacillus sp.]
MLNEAVLLIVFLAGILFGLVSLIVEFVHEDKVDYYQLSTSIAIIVVSTVSFFFVL